MNRIRFLCKVILLGCVFLSSITYAELLLEVERGNDNPTKIAVAPVSWRGATVAEDISAIVNSDLERSGLFRTVPQRDMLSFPGTVKQVRYRDWKILGAEYLVVTQVAPQGENRIAITFSLINITTQKPVFTHNLNGSRHIARKMAHRISDKVYEAVTGIPGAFSTQILYITSKPNPRGGILYRLMRADADGARETEIFKSSEPIMSPAWSPDGKDVLYVSFESGRSAIYRQNIATGKSEQLTNFRGINSAPAWSPDGNKLALTLSKDGNPELYLFDLRTRQFQRLTRQPGSRHRAYLDARQQTPVVHFR